MATATVALAPTSATDAEFRAWGSEISDQLLAMGWVKSADTGQIDWTTVLKPTAADQSRGYEIWGMGDALQAASPVYLKIEYGSAGSTTIPGIWLTVGFATDGAGNLTGTQQTTRVQIVSNGTATSTTSNCVFSGGTSWFGCILYVNSPTVLHTHWFSVERTKDASWADTSAGAIVCGGPVRTTNTQYSQPILRAAVGVPAIETRLPGIVSGNTSGARGTTVGYGFHVPLNGEGLHPGLGTILYARDDGTLGTPITLTINAVSHTYYPLGNNITNVGQAANSRVGIRWE